MPRSLRLHVPAAFYHVTLRGNHRQNIFFKPADRQLFEDITAEVLERFTARLHAYCLMSNHVHLLMQVGDTPLGRLMLRIASRYARNVQARLRTTGHLFERRYHAVLIDADEYLLELLRYIHLNPVRAHMVAHPSDYPWSSHHAYLGRTTANWVTTDFALAMFHAERDRAIAAYVRFVENDLDQPRRSPLEDCNPSDPRILGSDDFASRLLGAEWQPRSRKTLDDLANDACQRFSVSRQELLSRRRQREPTKARSWIAHEAIRLHIASLCAVARYLQRSESSLRESVKRYFDPPP